MKKALILCLLAILLVGFSTGESEAAPPGQAGQAVITSPRDNDVVRGLLVIKGTATHPNFWKYEIHYALEPTNQWVVLGVHETQVVDGRLEVWDTTQVPDGSYSLRLRVVRKDGNYDEYYVRQISVANAQPTETPTPAESPTPTATPVPIPVGGYGKLASRLELLAPWLGLAALATVAALTAILVRRRGRA